MPRIYDNIDQHLAPALQRALGDGRSADFCVGYFNLRGWHVLGDAVDALPPTEDPCRLLVGMHRAPQDLRRALHGAGAAEEPIDQQRAIRARRQITEEFRSQLAGVDDAALGDFVMLLHDEGRLVFTPDQASGGPREPVIVCSMGIR